MSSPRAWGCFLLPLHGPCLGRVFPTCVGVFLSPWLQFLHMYGLPHVRGGVSDIITHNCRLKKSSPRAWGCFLGSIFSSHFCFVFPTCVGVFLVHTVLLSSTQCLPHVRGGVSPVQAPMCHQRVSSPRAWGCFRFSDASALLSAVFPTCVGVFLEIVVDAVVKFSLPHVRGGVSFLRSLTRFVQPSSPRAWGCFPALLVVDEVGRVFPTCVGVFPRASRRR